MSLTQKQERFCTEYVTGGNASAAYRRAYDASGMKSTTVNRKAKEVLDNGKITARLHELRAPVVAGAQLTLERHLIDLLRLRDSAAAGGYFGAAVTAEVARGRASGLYRDIVESSNHHTVSVSAGTRIRDALNRVLQRP
jgi:phage terminase small subunit